MIEAYQLRKCMIFTLDTNIYLFILLYLFIYIYLQLSEILHGDLVWAKRKASNDSFF